MKFCRYCGTQLEDDELCKCDAAVKVYSKTTDEVSFADINISPKSANKTITDVIKSFFETYIGAWKNPRTTIETSNSGKHYLLGISGALYFIATLVFLTFFFLKIKNWTGDLLGGLDSWLGISDGMFDFSKVLLTSIIMAALIFVGNMLISFILTKVYSGNSESSNHIMCSTVFALPASTLLVIAGLLALLNPIVGLIVAVISGIHYVLGCLLTVYEKGCDLDKASNIYVNTLIVAAYVLVIIFVFARAFAWNINIIT